MILGLIELYKGILGVGVIAGIAFLLYSNDFVVIHRRFLGLVAIGTGTTIVSRLLFIVYWPKGSHWSTAILFAHLVFILFIVAGLYSLVTDYPVQNEERRGRTFYR
jgi:hypothetical protein